MTSRSNKLSEEKRSIEKAASLHWFHWVVVIASLVLTFFAWYVSKKSIDEKTALQFDRQAKQVVEMVSERMQKYEDGLWGGVSAIQAKGGDISYNNWRIFAQSLQIDVKYHGINGIGVIHYVRPEELNSYLQRQRKDRPDYHIHPKHNKEEFWPITYIEPADANIQVVGLEWHMKRIVTRQR